MTATDDVVKDESDDGPWDVVDSTGGGDGSSTTEDDGEVDKFKVGVGPLKTDEPLDKGACGTNEEEVYETATEGHE